jgi:hypothetical protein
MEVNLKEHEKWSKQLKKKKETKQLICWVSAIETHYGQPQGASPPIIFLPSENATAPFCSALCRLSRKFWTHEGSSPLKSCSWIYAA